MKRVIKLSILILISLSVYFIYQETNHKNIKILVLGDSLSLGINSYGIKEYGYVDYYKDYLVKKNKKISINKDYSKKELTIEELKEKIKTTPSLKKELSESHQIILNVGYNDLLYKLSLEQNNKNLNLNKNIKEIESSYQELIKEIDKYYNNSIILIGYPPSNQDDYYKNIGIKKINKILKNTPKSSYIDTYQLLNHKELFFSNPHSYYPNRYGYQAIAKKIIEKTLEKQEIIWYIKYALNYYDK